MPRKRNTTSRGCTHETTLDFRSRCFLGEPFLHRDIKRLQIKRNFLIHICFIRAKRGLLHPSPALPHSKRLVALILLGFKISVQGILMMTRLPHFISKSDGQAGAGDSTISCGQFSFRGGTRILGNRSVFALIQSSLIIAIQTRTRAVLPARHKTGKRHHEVRSTCEGHLGARTRAALASQR